MDLLIILQNVSRSTGLEKIVDINLGLWKLLLEICGFRLGGLIQTIFLFFVNCERETETGANASGTILGPLNGVADAENHIFKSKGRSEMVRLEPLRECVGL